MSINQKQMIMALLQSQKLLLLSQKVLKSKGVQVGLYSQ